MVTLVERLHAARDDPDAASIENFVNYAAGVGAGQPVCVFSHAR